MALQTTIRAVFEFTAVRTSNLTTAKEVGNAENQPEAANQTTLRYRKMAYTKLA